MGKCMGIGTKECFQAEYKDTEFCVDCLIKVLEKNKEQLQDENKRLEGEIFQYNEELSDALTDSMRLRETLSCLKISLLQSKSLTLEEFVALKDLIKQAPEPEKKEE